MKVKDYKGFEIEVCRERCLGGWKIIYYSVFRNSDGMEMISGFSDTGDTVRDFIKMIKDRIDEYLSIPDAKDEDF